MRLVDHVFAEFLCDGQSQSDILSMMEMYGLIARFTPKSEAGEDSPAVKYFVPAQLCSCPETELDTTESQICPLYINFPDGFLPHGLFPQLVSRFISVCPELGCTDEPNLFQNLARFILGEDDFFLIGKQSFVKVILQTKTRMTKEVAKPVWSASAWIRFWVVYQVTLHVFVTCVMNSL